MRAKTKASLRLAVECGRVAAAQLIGSHVAFAIVLVGPCCDQLHKDLQEHAAVNSLFTPTLDAVLSVLEGMRRLCTDCPGCPGDAHQRQLGQGFEACYAALSLLGEARPQTNHLCPRHVHRLLFKELRESGCSVGCLARPMQHIKYISQEPGEWMFSGLPCKIQHI